MDTPVSSAAPRVDPLLGQTIEGRYVIDSRLGEGGMGVVYAGRHRIIGKKVAVKVLRGEMATDPELLQRFYREAQSASAIGSPHIVDISDFGQLPDRSTYFVMELLEGETLSHAIASSRGPMPLARLCNIGKQIARGLAAAHSQSVVHRDLKPDNVMLVQRGTQNDFVKILDFGIAKIGASKMTRAGSVFGTPHYMSPEQAIGKPVDHRTDVYALGVILYEMASGLVPFQGKDTMTIVAQHVQRPPVPLRQLVPYANVPPELDAIVMRCLSKVREQRYPTMDALVADLEQLERSLPPPVDTRSTAARTGGYPVSQEQLRPGVQPGLITAHAARPPPRWPLYVILGVGALILTLAAVVLAVRLGHGRTAHGQAPSSSSLIIAFAFPETR